MWLVDISPPTRDWTKARLKVPYPNPWATREFPDPVLLFSPKLSQPCPVYFLCLHALPSSIHSANNFFKKQWNILLKQNVGDRSTIIKVQLLWLKCVLYVCVCDGDGPGSIFLPTPPSQDTFPEPPSVHRTHMTILALAFPSHDQLWSTWSII